MCLGPKFLKSGCLGVLVASWVRSGVLVYRSGFWNSSFFVVQSYDYDWISVMHTYLWLAMFSLFFSVDFLNKVIHYNSCLSACSRAWPVALVLLHKATTKQLPLQSLSFCTLDIDLQKFLNYTIYGGLGWIFGAPKMRHFFKAPIDKIQCVFFSIEASAKTHSKKMQNASSIASLFTNSFAILWCLFEEDTLFVPRPYHGGRQDTMATMSSAPLVHPKKSRWKIFPIICGVGRDSDFFGQKWKQKKHAPEKTDGENRWDIFLFWLHNPHEKWKKLPAYLNWLDLVHE